MDDWASPGGVQAVCPNPGRHLGISERTPIFPGRGRLGEPADAAKGQEEVEGQGQAGQADDGNGPGGGEELGEEADEEAGQGSEPVVQVVDALDPAAQGVGDQGLDQGVVAGAEGAPSKADNDHGHHGEEQPVGQAQEDDADRGEDEGQQAGLAFAQDEADGSDDQGGSESSDAVGGEERAEDLRASIEHFAGEHRQQVDAGLNEEVGDEAEKDELKDELILPDVDDPFFHVGQARGVAPPRLLPVGGTHRDDEQGQDDVEGALDEEVELEAEGAHQDAANGRPDEAGGGDAH